MSTTVKSPCISVCVMNDDGFCEGCYRTGQEIAYWMQYDNEQKRTVVEHAEQRRKDAGMSL